MDVSLKKYKILFNLEKNKLLLESRNICFDDVIEAIESGDVLDIAGHYNQSNYSHQALIIFKKNGYAHVVPCVFDSKTKSVFLKTVYASRKYTKRYL